MAAEAADGRGALLMPATAAAVAAGALPTGRILILLAPPAALAESCFEASGASGLTVVVLGAWAIAPDIAWAAWAAAGVTALPMGDDVLGRPGASPSLELSSSLKRICTSNQAARA